MQKSGVCPLFLNANIDTAYPTVEILTWKLSLRKEIQVYEV